MRVRIVSPLVLVALLGLSSAAAAAADTPVPFATPRSGFIGADAMTSTVFQQDQSSFSGIALRVRLRSPALVPAVEFLPTFEYWQNTSKLDAFGIETTRRDATLGADARWVFKHAAWQPYAGAGFGLHFLDDEVRAPKLGVPHATHALVKGGLEALGGVQFGMGTRLGSFLELKLLNVTQYRQYKFNTGLSWNL